MTNEGTVSGRAELWSDSPLVTVLIPARNEESSLGACLASVRSQDFEALQIVVVDNASSDGTSSIVERHRAEDHRIDLVRNPRPGISASLNAGLRQARGTWLVRVDAHSTVGPDYVRLAVERLRDGGWGGVGGRKDGVGVTPAGRAIATAMASRFGVGGSTYHYGTAPLEVDHIPFGAYPTALLRELGGWDEQIEANEDFELDQRVRGTGERLLFDPRLVVQWHCRQSVVPLFQQYRRYGRGKFAVAARHPRSMKLRHVLPPAAVAWFALALTVALRRPRLSIGMVAPYGTAVAVASVASAGRLSSSREKLVLPLAYIAMHVGWGLGFWQGSCRWLADRTQQARHERRGGAAAASLGRRASRTES